MENWQISMMRSLTGWKSQRTRFDRISRVSPKIQKLEIFGVKKKLKHGLRDFYQQYRVERESTLTVQVKSIICIIDLV